MMKPDQQSGRTDSQVLAAQNGSAQVFASTSITSGRAVARVIATGVATEFGQVAQLTGSVGTKTTNLQQNWANWRADLELRPYWLAQP